MADVFSALADPTRRQIFERLVAGGPTTATQLSGEFGITRQAVSKHLGLLEAAELVTRAKRGRETHFEPRPQDLQIVTAWAARMQDDWRNRMDVLKKIVDG